MERIFFKFSNPLFAAFPWLFRGFMDMYIHTHNRYVYGIHTRKSLTPQGIRLFIVVYSFFRSRKTFRSSLSPRKETMRVKN